MTGIVALYIFMLAAFTGYEVISRVPVILHTPLMSGSNFVHGIVLVGAMVALGGAHTPLEKTIGVIGVLLAAGNAVGGYVVTERMLEMFKSSGARGAAKEESLMPAWASRELLIQASYLVTALLFIIGLKRMSSPVSARSGILWAGAGMAVATLVTFLYPGMTNYELIVPAMFVGAGLAWWSGKRVAMTDMPQMIALYNGMGGGAAAAIAAVELYRGDTHGYAGSTLAVAGGLIGAVSFSGSAIAFGKLQGLIKRSLRFGGQQLLNLLLLVAAVALGVTDRRAPERRAHGGDGPVPGRVAARADDDAADRRRRHAGGDLALQRAHRAGGRFRGFRAQQRRDDHRRHRGRLGRHAAHAADGQGHEPLPRQRAVLGLRRHRWRGHGHRHGAA